MAAPFHDLPLIDVLYRLCELHHQPFKLSPLQRRASVAIVLRLATPNSPIKHAQENQEKRTPPPAPSGSSSSYLHLLSVMNSLVRSSWFESSYSSLGLEVLFIQRAKNPKDRWSGQLAFPGGRQQKGETDVQTAMREVEEETGLPLADANQFLLLGRLSDRDINSFSNVKALAVCPFVFLQIVPETPPFSLQTKEIASIIWTPLSFFTSPSLHFNFLVHPLILQYFLKNSRRKIEIQYEIKRKNPTTATLFNAMFEQEGKSQTGAAAAAPSETKGNRMSLALDRRFPLGFSSLLPNALLKLNSVQFPALALPGRFLEATGKTGISRNERIYYDEEHQTAGKENSSSALSSPPAGPATDEVGHDCTFILWGFTLSLLSDYLSSSFHCFSLSSVLEKGAKERNRALLTVHRLIDFNEGIRSKRNQFLQKFLVEKRGGRGDAAAQAAGKGGKSVSSDRQEKPTASGSSEGEIEVEINEKLMETLEINQDNRAGKSSNSASRIPARL